jgi:hypothetical protein
MAKNTDNAQTCRDCGALVDSEMTWKHVDWHKKITADVEDAIKQAAKKAERRARGGATDGWG